MVSDGRWLQLKLTHLGNRLLLVFLFCFVFVSFVTIIPFSFKNRTVTATWNLLSKEKCELDPESQLRVWFLVVKSLIPKYISLELKKISSHFSMARWAACEKTAFTGGSRDLALVWGLWEAVRCVYTGYVKTLNLGVFFVFVLIRYKCRYTMCYTHKWKINGGPIVRARVSL